MQTVVSSNLKKEVKTVLTEISNCNSRLIKKKLSDHQLIHTIEQKEELVDILHDLADEIIKEIK